MMGFLGSYAAFAGDPAADAAWRGAEAWLISRARRGRAGRLQWPRSDSHPASSDWWCHGAPGIALGWLCVAQAKGTAAIAEEHLRRALGASPTKPRNDSLGQCHGLAGIGEIYLEAHRARVSRGVAYPANPRPTPTASCSARRASCTSSCGITIRTP